MSNLPTLNQTSPARPAEGTTAATHYTYHQSLVLQLLARARVALEAHQLAAAASPANWGYAGDMGAAADRSLEVLAALEPAGT